MTSHRGPPVAMTLNRGVLTSDFCRTAIRTLERAGLPRSAAMAMGGHKTQSVCGRYAIADESLLREGAVKLQALHASETTKRKQRGGARSEYGPSQLVGGGIS
jgi:hypothetical protein